MKTRKILSFSTQIGGGCFQYSDLIMSHLSDNVEKVVPEKVLEHMRTLPSWTIKYIGFSSTERLTSYVLTFIKILDGIIEKKYNSILFFGITTWDYYYIKLFRIFKIPIFVVIHDGKMHSSEFNKKFQSRMIKIMNYATHLIFLSDYVRLTVKESLGINKPYLIVPHGLIDYGLIPACEKNSNKPTLLFFGRVSRYKGVDLLMESMKQVDETKYNKLIIAGKWDYAVPEHYNGDKIEIVNEWLTNDEKLNYLSQADMMLFPYLEATQSGVATLAINYQKPSIVTKVGAFAEQFDKGSVIYVKPNAHELASAINNLLDDNQKLATMKCAMERLKNKYSWHNIVKEFELQLNDIINNYEKNYPSHQTVQLTLCSDAAMHIAA